MKYHKNLETGDMFWCRLRPNRGMNKWWKKGRSEKVSAKPFSLHFSIHRMKGRKKMGEGMEKCVKKRMKIVETLKLKWFRIERRLKNGSRNLIKIFFCGRQFYIFFTLQITFSSEDHWEDSHHFSSSRLNLAYRYGDIEAEKFQQTLMHIVFLTAKRIPKWMIILVMKMVLIQQLPFTKQKMWHEVSIKQNIVSESCASWERNVVLELVITGREIIWIFELVKIPKIRSYWEA